MAAASAWVFVSVLWRTAAQRVADASVDADAHRRPRPAAQHDGRGPRPRRCARRRHRSTDVTTAAADLETARYPRAQSGRQPPPPPAAHPLAGTMTLPDTLSAPDQVRGALRRRGALIAALLTGALVIAAVMPHPRPPEPKSTSGLSSGIERPIGSRRTRQNSIILNSGGGWPATRACWPSRALGAAAATADQFARAITDYYALLPDNVQEGWARLTPSYRQAGAPGIWRYKKFGATSPESRPAT